MPPPRNRPPTVKKPDTDFPVSNNGHNVPGKVEGASTEKAEAGNAADSGKGRPSDGGFKVPAVKPRHSLPTKNPEGEPELEGEKDVTGRHINRPSDPPKASRTESLDIASDKDTEADPKARREVIDRQDASRSVGGEEAKDVVNKAADGEEQRKQRDAKPSDARPSDVKPSTSKPSKTAKTAYSEPAWAANPVSAFSIEVLKDGSFVENLDV